MYLLRTKVSCKVVEIAATRSLNAQLFFIKQHTKRSMKRGPTYWDYYIMAISLTFIIAHLINILDLSFLFYFMLLYWIAGIGIVFHFHCKHTQSLFKPFPRNQLATKAQSFPRKSSNTASRMIARQAKDFTWNRGCSSNSPPLKHGDQIPHPLEDSDNQIPSSPGRQRCQMPGVCPGEGHVEASIWPINYNYQPFLIST